MSSTTPEQLFTDSIAANRELANTIQQVNSEQNTRFDELQTLSGKQFSDQKTQIEKQLADHKKQADGHLTASTEKVDTKLESVSDQVDQFYKDAVLGDTSRPGSRQMVFFQGHIFQTKDGTSEGGFESENINIGTNSNVFFHLKTPVNVNKSSYMYLFHVYGYAYGQSDIIDEHISGYCYPSTKSLIRKKTKDPIAQIAIWIKMVFWFLDFFLRILTIQLFQLPHLIPLSYPISLMRTWSGLLLPRVFYNDFCKSQWR